MFKIADSHNDFLTNNKCSIPNLNNDFKKNNVALCNAILFSNNEQFSIKKANLLKNKITNYKFLNSACIYSFENLSFLKQKEYDAFVKFKPFSASLTWNYENQFAGGAYSFSKLSNKGKEFIKILNRNNIVLDVAHLNRQSFWNALKVCDKPILNSHSCFNIKEQIKAIIDSNGFIGVTFVCDFLTNNEKTDANNVFQNIDTIIQKFGIKNLGIGTDFWGTNDLPLNLKNYCDFNNLYNIFKNNGYKEIDIHFIFYKNFYNFVKSNYKYL